MKSKKPGGIFEPESLKTEIESLEVESSKPNFWKNRENAEKIISRIKKMKIRMEPWGDLKSGIRDLSELYNLTREEKDQSLEVDIQQSYDALEKRFHEIRILEFLGEAYDESSAFLAIHSGAGGTEACDWVNMLLRMYIRWTERHGYRSEIVDLLGAEGGLKSATLHVAGNYAYGYLKGENGIHRLVRISPFDSGKRRHTSFASVFAMPEIEDDINIEIKPDEIRIDTYRAQGAGGQHVNKTDSAVRITHLPTNIVVQCQNERSQHKNKAMAVKVLKSRLFNYYREERDKEKEKLTKDKKDISWGNQIRSYIFHPYTMVKDHRTKFETGNIQAVMDGEIESFIEKHLKFAWSGKK